MNRGPAHVLPETPDQKAARIAREIQRHVEEIARLTAELGAAPSCSRTSSLFKRKGLTQEQFEAALQAQGKL